MSLRYAALGAAVSVAFSLGSTEALAGPVVSNGLHLYFSSRGQEYFREYLNTVLLANKIDLSKTHWDEIKFVVNDSSDRVVSDEDRVFEGFRTLRDRLAPYFYGFPVNRPKVELTLANSDLTVKFKAMSAEIDPAGPSAYGKAHSKGLVILMRLEVEGLQFDVESARLNDLANPGLLGVLGLDKVSTKLTDGNLRTVKAELPILFEADGKKATMKVLGIRTNLENNVFESNFEHMRVPSLKMVINEKEFVFDQGAFERDLRDRLRGLNDAMVKAVKNYFEKQGSDLIQSQFDELAQSLNIDFPISFSDDPTDPKDLMIHLRPKAAAYTRTKQMGISFDAEISDEMKSAWGRDALDTVGEAGIATFSGSDPATYDVAMTLHPAAVNGVLNRAWAKGVLRDIEMGNDDSGHSTKVKISKPPIVAFGNLPKPNQANFHAWIGYVVHGLGGILFKGPIPIELDLVVNLETNEKNEIEVVLDHIDESTLMVDTTATWLSPIRGLVNSMVRGKIGKLNKNAQEKRQILTSVPTLDDLIGIPIKLDAAKTDAGNLVLLADFASKS